MSARLGMMGNMLSDRDRRVLELEGRTWSSAAAKENAIRDEFGLSVARFYQVLNTVIEDPDALRFDPHLVHTLLNAQSRRRAARERRGFTPKD